MDVIIHSNVTGLLGTTVISTDAEQTVNQLLRAFCSEKGVHYRLDLVLTNCRDEVMHGRRKLASYGVANGEELYVSVKETEDEWPCGCNQWYLLSVVTFLIGAVGLVAVCIIRTQDHSYSHSYGVGVDAGSSHTSIYVYKWPAQKLNGTGIVEQVLKCPPTSQPMRPLSSFVDHPSDAGHELEPCLDRAKGLVPHQQRGATPIFFGATAGMRLLGASNESAAEAIMESVRITIAAYPFLLRNRREQVRILAGTEEATFSWIATNYLAGNLGFQPLAQINQPIVKSSVQQPKTLGALDMGGASTQITFVPENPAKIEPIYNCSVGLYGIEYKLYTHSYLCYGVNEAYRQYLAHLVQTSNYSESLSDPCGWTDSVTSWSYEDIFRVPCTLATPTDFNPRLKGKVFTFTGTDNMTACRSEARQLFNFSAPCPYSHCSFNGTYQPPLYGQFMGFSGFYYAMKDLHLTLENNTFDDFISAVNNCTNILSPAQNLTSCFQIQFISVLLTDGYGFNASNWDTLRINKKLNGVEMGWVLGMMINMTNVVPVPEDVISLSLPVFVLLLILFVVFLVISISFLCHACRCRRKLVYEVLPTTGTGTSTYGAI